MELTMPALAHRVTVFGSTRNAVATSAGVISGLAVMTGLAFILLFSLSRGVNGLLRALPAPPALTGQEPRPGLGSGPVRLIELAGDCRDRNAQYAGNPVNGGGPGASLLPLDVGEGRLTHPGHSGEVRLVPAVLLAKTSDGGPVLAKSFSRRLSGLPAGSDDRLCRAHAAKH